MTIIRSHWLWFFSILTVVSGLDYWDHISRSGSPFMEAPGAWFGFTLASHASLCVIAYLAAKAIGWLPLPQLAADTVGVGFAIALHLVVTGPLWDMVFWDGNLRFNAVIMPVLAGAALYLFYRGVFAFIALLRRNPPKSLP